MRTPAPAIAVTIALFGGAVLALGSALPVVSGGARGFASTPLLVLLAALPVAVAGLLLRRQPAAALGVLTGLAALVPGRIVLELRFAGDASVVSRPALYMPDTLAALPPASGLWLMLGGHVGVLAAGVLAVRSRAAAEGAVGESLGSSSPGAPRRGLLPAAACVGTLTAVGSLMAPFASTDAYLVPQGALESGGLGLAGSLLLAAALPLATVSAVSTGRLLFARGCFIGLGLGALATSLPNVVAALVMAELSLRPGAVIVVAGALGLLALVALTGDRGAKTEPAGAADAMVGTTATDDKTGSSTPANGAVGENALEHSVNAPVTYAGYARMPSLRRFEIAVATAALATCAAALTGSLTSQVTSAMGGSGKMAPQWPLLTAGIVTGLLGAMLLVPRTSGWLRPVLSVGWLSVPVAGMSTLGTGVAAGETGGVLAPGPGALWTVLAMVLAVVTACLSAVAGVLDREDVSGSLPDGPRGRGGPGGVPLAIATAGAVLAVLGFVLPVSYSADYPAPGLVTDPSTGSWGLLAGLLGVLATVVIAMYSRPVRAVAVLAGAVCVSALRTAEWPLATLGVSDTDPAVGWWFALLGTLVLAAAAGTIVVGRLPSRNTARTV